MRAETYRALPAPVLACRYEGLSGDGPAVNLQPGDHAARSLRAAGLRILNIPAEEARRPIADFHGTTVVRASRELFGIFNTDRFERLGGDTRYFAMGAYDNTLLGAVYRELYDEPFASEPDGTHLAGSVTAEVLRKHLARSRDPRLLIRLYAYFERSKGALARLAAHEGIVVRPPRVFSLPREMLLSAAVKILAISEFPKGRKYLISLSFRGKASVRPAQVGGFDVNIVIHGSTAVRGRGDLVAYRWALWKLTVPWTHRTRPPHLGKRCAFSTSFHRAFPIKSFTKNPERPQNSVGKPG